MQDDKIIQDYEDLFLGKRQGHLTQYAYDGNNDFYDKLITENKDYYLTYKEKDLLINSAKKIATILGPNVNLIEIGPGSEFSLEYKVIPFIKLLGNASSYTAIDFNIKYAEQAANLVNKTLPRKQCSFFEGDFTEGLPNIPNDNKCLLFLGSTISNFTDDQIKRIFFCFNRAMNKNDYLIFSVDCNRDLDQISRAYNNKWMKNLTYNILEFFKDTFKVQDLQLDLFDFYFEWNSQKNEVELGVISTQQQIFSFKKKKFLVPQNTKYHLITSRKFGKSFIDQNILAANFKTVTIFADPENAVLLYVVQK